MKIGKENIWTLARRAFLLGLAAPLAGGLALSRAHAEIAGPEIRIGVAVPLSGHGADAGKREAIGVQAAIDEINAAGGVGGVLLKMYLADTASNPQEAINSVRKLAGDDKVLAIIGPHYSSEAETTFPLGNQLRIVQISVASSKPGVSAANRPYGFRNTLAEDKIADVVIAKFKERYGVKNVALISDMKDAVARSLGTAVFPAALKANGIGLATGNSPVTFQTNDAQFTAQVTKLKASNPDGIGLGALGPDALNIITEARRQGLTQPFFGTAPIMEGNLPEKGGKAVEGTFGGNVWHVSIESARSRRFVGSYRNAQKKLFTGPFTETPDYYPANAYDCVYMLKQAIEKNGVSNKPTELAADREKIMKYLTGLNDFEGVASRGFDKSGDGLKDVYVFEIAGGVWRQVK